jgi:8-oxo-dGTP pyrophosphatase MutT (NUDIX family)
MTDNNSSGRVIHKDVATSVISYNGKILVLRRSQKVGTYKGDWACVSGYIEEEETPIQTAYKELSEEVGLRQEDVELVTEGEVVHARDGEILWVIHPFHFRAKTNIIKIDWEHVEYKWIFAEELDDLPTVPKLKETIMSVFVEQKQNKG